MDGSAQAGHRIGGRYRLVRQIGSGGMGCVWEAEDEVLSRAVAVKELLMPVVPAARQDERLERARREAVNAARLDHPNVVTVHDVVVEDGEPWIVMQLVRGRSLREVLQESGRLDVEQVARIAEAVLSALRAAHEGERQIVHRDVKPANILLADDGRILLTDFGIAKAIDDTTVTVSGTFVGSVAYIAPERAEGAHGEPPADLFSLGVTLFEAVEGFCPFQKDSHTGTLTAILVKPLPPMAHAGRLAILIQALTAKDPGRRPTATQALALLHGVYSDYRMPDADGGLETVQLPNPRGGTASHARLPWQTVDISRTTGGPKPPVVGNPEPPPPKIPRNRTPWVLAIAFAALLVATLRVHGLTGTVGNTYLAGNVTHTVEVVVFVSTQTALGWHSSTFLGAVGAITGSIALASLLATMAALRPSTPAGVRIAGYAASALALALIGGRIARLAWEDNRAQALELWGRYLRMTPVGGKSIRYHESTHVQAGVFLFLALLVLLVASYTWCEIRNRDPS